MSKIKVQISRIAKLANLKLTEDQKAKYQGQVEQVLDLMEEIKKLDLTQVAPTSRVIAEENIMREDAIEPSFTQEQALQNAPKTHDGYFVVPAIFEGRDE